MKNRVILFLLGLLCVSCVKKEFRIVEDVREKTLNDFLFTYTTSKDSLCLSGEDYAQHAIALGNLIQMTARPELLKNQETILDSTGILFVQNWFNNGSQKDCFNKEMAKEILNSEGASIETILTPINLAIGSEENATFDDFIYGSFFLSNLLSVYMITDSCKNVIKQEVPVSLTIDEYGEVINNRFLYHPQKAHESVIKQIIESPFFKWQPLVGSNEYRYITIAFDLYTCTENPLFSLKERSIEVYE